MLACAASTYPHTISKRPAQQLKTPQTDALPIVTYASHASIYLYDPSSLSLLSGAASTSSTGQPDITSIRWITRDTLASGDAAGQLALWRYDDTNEKPRVKQYWSIGIAKGSVNYISPPAVASGDGGKILFSACSSTTGKVGIYSLCDNGVMSEQVIDLSPVYPTCCALACLGNDKQFVLAIGTTGLNILIFTATINTASEVLFEKTCELVGHSDWIRDLKFTTTPDTNTILLASASQDKYTRIWRFTSAINNNTIQKEDLDTDTITCGTHHINLDTVLMGHEDAVLSLDWLTSTQLLSCSADKTFALWAAPEHESTEWSTRVQLGDFGGTSYGIFGVLFASATCIVTVSYYGSIQQYHTAVGSDKWQCVGGVTGHAKAVTDMTWSWDKRYLLSVSQDQTTRVWSCLPGMVGWKEIARAQVHGYDLNCITLIGSEGVYAVGSDGEKIVRVFKPSARFMRFLRDGVVCSDEDEVDVVASLGLSNKSTAAVSEASGISENAAVGIEAQCITESSIHNKSLWPECDKLYGHGDDVFTLQSSHDNRLLLTAAVVRTSSVSSVNDIEGSGVLLWSLGKNNEEWTVQRPQVSAQNIHTMTVTKCRFSWSDQWVLMVGRDRITSLHRVCNGESSPKLELSHFQKESHARVIWDAAWLHDDSAFATASRDKSVKIWSLAAGEGKFELKQTIKFSHPVSAIDALPVPLAVSTDGVVTCLLVVGLENGGVVYLGASGDGQFEVFKQVEMRDCPSMAVTKLAFRVTVPEDTMAKGDQLWCDVVKREFSERVIGGEKKSIEVAIASKDGSVRVVEFNQ